jgi:glycine/D-amino acid oxidase-like deaminating enzyme
LLRFMADIVVVGAGVFGVWTAHHLINVGARVTLVDAHGPANARASSGDESRIIRCGYGPDAIYSRWARESLTHWRDLFARVGAGQAPLFHPCGVLWLGDANDPYVEATHATLKSGGMPVERLDPTELSERVPHIAASDLPFALLEPDCGVIMARRAVQTLVADLESRGARYVRAHVESPAGAGRLASVTLRGGRTLSAASFVFACGPWLPKVFPELLAHRIRPTRQSVIYFGTPAGDDRWGPSCTPAWVDFAAGIYGVPDLEHRGIKVGLDRHGAAFDPDSDDRIVDAASIETARAWLERRMPDLAGAPVVESRVCQYENTDTGDFLIDRHPGFENVWIAGGGSGHGFKHGPALGAYVSGLVRGTAAQEPRFALSARGVAAQRSVY